MGLVIWTIVFPVPSVAADEAIQEMSVVGPGAYVSPQFGNEVTWAEGWTLDDTEIQSDDTLLLDRLSLLYNENGTVVIMFIAAAGEQPDAYARRLVRYRRITEPDANVVWGESTVDSSAMLYSFRLDDRDVASLIEIRLVNDDTTLQVVELLVYEEYAETVFDRAQSDIQVDGDGPFAFVSDFPVDEFAPQANIDRWTMIIRAHHGDP